MTYSHPVNDIGHPIIPPEATTTVIKPKDNTLCWFWQHEYVFTGQMIAHKVTNVPRAQVWACRKCQKMKYTDISA